MNIADIKANTVKREALPSGGDTFGKKFLLTLKDGETLLLREGKLEDYPTFQNTYNALRDIENLHLSGIPKALFLDRKDGKSYMILTYFPGETLEKAIRFMPAAKQNALGQKTGSLLSAIHSITPEEPSQDYGDYEIGFKRILSDYTSLALYVPGEKALYDYILANMKAVMNQNDPAYIHGGVRLKYLVEYPKDNVSLVDFRHVSIFDPYYDFRFVESAIAPLSIPFAKGMIEGYFDHLTPADDFLMAFEVYSAFQGLENAVKDSLAGNVAKAVKDMRKLIYDFDGFRETVMPRWLR